MMENIKVLTSSLDFLTINSLYLKKNIYSRESSFFSTNSLIYACMKTPIQEEQFKLPIN